MLGSYLGLICRRRPSQQPNRLLIPIGDDDPRIDRLRSHRQSEESLVLEYMDLSAGDPALDLAIDETLLLRAETTNDSDGLLRIWEPTRTMVVVGRGSKVHEEVHWELCQEESIPVLRRCSGGASVVGAPGCLMYSVVLSYDRFPQLRRLDQAHQYVMSRILAAVKSLGIDASLQGTCDLTLNNSKVSGNALRCRKQHLLYHGTLLYDMDLSLLDRLLRMPPRQPDYRKGREHRSFVDNLPVDRNDLIESLRTTWRAEASSTNDSCDNSWIERSSLEPEWESQVEQLVEQRYRQDDWNLRL